MKKFLASFSVPFNASLLVPFFTSAVVFIAVFTFTSFSIKTVSADAFSGTGTGIEEDPYAITSCSELQEMNLDLSAYYKLDATEGVIDCSMINPSSGNFDGEGGVWADSGNSAGTNSTGDANSTTN